MKLFSHTPGDTPRPPTWTSWRIAAAAIAGVLALGALISLGQVVEVLESNKVMVIQTVGGSLECYTEPGPKIQAFGTVTKYPRRGTYAFNSHGSPKETASADTGKPLQFNDGGKATLYGTVNWEMPTDCKAILRAHRDFGSAEGIENSAVARMVNSAVYLSGPMMSSTESAAEKRSMLVDLINDQAQRGVYQTQTRAIEQTDSAGDKRSVNVVEIIREANGTPRRQQGSILEAYGIHLQPMSIEALRYSPEVEKQIQQRQDAIQQVRLAQENARKAQQDAITAEENGKATAAKAKWEQETIKAKVVTEAQQKLEVATLAAKEAEQYKREQVLRGEGDAERRRLVLNADGALDAKLDAYKAVHALWAQNFGQFKGQLVPQVTMGGAAGASANAMTGAQSLLDMLSVKAAKDLALDLSNTGAAQTAAKGR